MWLGLSDEAVEGSYEWVDGNFHIPASDWAAWSPAHPISSALLNCAMVDAGFQWLQRSCASAYATFCQKQIVGMPIDDNRGSLSFKEFISTCTTANRSLLNLFNQIRSSHHAKCLRIRS